MQIDKTWKFISWWWNQEEIFFNNTFARIFGSKNVIFLIDNEIPVVNNRQLLMKYSCLLRSKITNFDLLFFVDIWLSFREWNTIFRFGIFAWKSKNVFHIVKVIMWSQQSFTLNNKEMNWTKTQAKHKIEK